jgi:hypothetical protein
MPYNGSGPYALMGTAMAKGQKKSNKEVRKPKAEKPKGNTPLAPSGSVKGLENMRNA